MANIEALRGPKPHEFSHQPDESYYLKSRVGDELRHEVDGVARKNHTTG